MDQTPEELELDFWERAPNSKPLYGADQTGSLMISDVWNFQKIQRILNEG